MMGLSTAEADLSSRCLIRHWQKQAFLEGGHGQHISNAVQGRTWFVFRGKYFCGLLHSSAWLAHCFCPGVGMASRDLLLGQHSWSGQKCKILLHLEPAPQCPVLEKLWAREGKQGLKCVDPEAHLWTILPNHSACI